MGKPFKIKHGLLCSGHLLEVDNERDEVRIKGTRAATIDDLVGGGGSIGDINDLTTGDHSSIVGAINEVDGNTTSNANSISSLQGDLAQEILDRQSGDASLTTSLSNEVNGRINAISAVQGDVDQEILDRQTADNNLQTAINTEETARTDGDTTLDTRITNEVAALVQADSNQYDTLHQEVLDETTARTIVDGSLQTQINAITSDQNKFYSLTLDAFDVNYDLSNGNFVVVTANQSGRAVILPAEIPNGGIKLYLQNDGEYPFDVQDSNFNTLISISSQDFATYELVFDDSNGLWIINVIDEANNFNFVNDLDTAFEHSFLSEGSINDVEVFGSNSEFVSNIVYDQDSAIWKFSILRYSDLVELASYTFSTPSSTKVTAKLLSDVTNYKFLIAFEDQINAITFDGSNITFDGTQTLSELSAVDISEMLIIDDSSILIESHTATDRNIKKYAVSGTTFTHIPTADLDITETVYGDLTKLYKFSDERFALYRENSTTVKQLTTFSIINDIAVQLNVKNFTTNSESIGIIDSNSFIISESTSVKCYHYNTLTSYYDASNFAAKFDNNIDLTNAHLFYVFDFVDPNAKIYERLGILFEKGSNKIIIFTINRVTQIVSFIDTKVHNYQLNNNVCANVSIGEHKNTLYFGTLNGAGNHFGITKFTLGQYFSESYTTADVSYSKFIAGDIANYKNIKSDLIEADNVEANFFIGDGSQLTGIPGGYDQSLNTTDNVAFNQVTSTFYGDGSHLTGIPGGYDQDLNTTNDVTFNQVTANSFVGLPPSLKVFTINAGEGVANPTAIEDRTYTLPESGVGWQVGNAANMNAANLYGTEMGTSADDMIIVHPKNTPPFMVKVQRNKNKGFAAGMGITEYSIAYKANIANTAIRIDQFPEEEYEFWIQIVFL